MSISAVILAKNEERSIEKCIQNLQWCDEVIVLDDGSTDMTRDISKKFKAKVYEHALSQDFAKQRNFGLKKAKGEWILFVDADEIVSEELKGKILHSILDNKKNGFYVKRLDYMWGKALQHGEQGSVKLLRLARKDTGKWVGNVHEVWNVQGQIGDLTTSLLHYPHQTLSEFLEEINFYSTLRAQELFKQHEPSNWFLILLYTKGKFIQDYIIKLGFLDGIEGFLVALLMSFHSFLVRGKLWQLNQE